MLGSGKNIYNLIYVRLLSLPTRVTLFYLGTHQPDGMEQTSQQIQIQICTKTNPNINICTNTNANI